MNKVVLHSLQGALILYKDSGQPFVSDFLFFMRGASHYPVMKDQTGGNLNVNIQDK